MAYIYRIGLSYIYNFISNSKACSDICALQAFFASFQEMNETPSFQE